MGYCNAESRDKGTHGLYKSNKTFKKSSVFCSSWSSLKYAPIVHLALGICLFTWNQLFRRRRAPGAMFSSMYQLMEAWKVAQAQARSASWLWKNKDVGRLCKSGEKMWETAYKALEIRRSVGLNGNGEMGWKGAGVLVTVHSLTKLRRSSSKKMNSGSLHEPGRQQVLSAVLLMAVLNGTN